MVKFKIGFEIGAETLFGMLSKMLPIDNLHVEEIVERPHPKPMPKIARMVQQSVPKPKRAKRRGDINLSQGMNRIVVDAWADGKPHRALELGPLFREQGFSVNSVNSLLERLRGRGVVTQPEKGLWQLVSS